MQLRDGGSVRVLMYTQGDLTWWGLPWYEMGEVEGQPCPVQVGWRFYNDKEQVKWDVAWAQTLPATGKLIGEWAAISAGMGVGGGGTPGPRPQGLRTGLGAADDVAPWSRSLPKSALRVGNYKYTQTAGKHANDIVGKGPFKGELARPYMNSPHTVNEIISTGKGIADPGGIPGALRYNVPGSFRGSTGTWELVVDPETKTIYHFLFKSVK